MSKINISTINHPLRSKINGMGIATILVGMAVSHGWVPEELHDSVMEIAHWALGIGVIVLRTWFTGDKT